jgi:hypothetical protein
VRSLPKIQIRIKPSAVNEGWHSGHPSLAVLSKAANGDIDQYKLKNDLDDCLNDLKDRLHAV